MLPKSAVDRIEEIANDRVSGATDLGLRAGALLAVVPATELTAAAEAVVRAQPAMAPVYNAARAALDGGLAEFIERLRGANEAIARKAAGLLRGRVVLTHSSSSTVLAALRAGDPARVICTESEPGGEGRVLAALLGAEVVPDAGVDAALAGVDVVVVGADAVTPEMVVNKIGTAMVALAARERGKHAWVLCGTAKFVPGRWEAKMGSLFERTPRGWFSGIVDEV